AERGNEPVSNFSGGMKRRLNLACGMIHQPSALLLDEPTVGVDPQSRERIFGSIKAAASAGAAVLYSTNYMEEAEQLCDRVILIDNGKIVAEGTAGALIARAGAKPQLEILTRRKLPKGWSSEL